MDSDTIRSDIPSRLDRLLWCRFHTLVVVALGITWILDGLEVTLAGAVSGALKASPALQMTDAQVGISASAYVLGAVLGSLVFGWMADRLGRKKLFSLTLAVYLVATAATAFSPNFGMFLLFRFFTGAGIGGEYSAINSAIQELVPARYRGHTDLVINGSFWIGAALGAVGSIVLLQPGLLPDDMGWRVAFGIGAVLGLSILLLRRFLPESPRWLMTRGRIAEAEAIVARIEAVAGERRVDTPLKSIELRVRAGGHGIADLAPSLFRTYPRRATVAMVLMSSQAFFYNAIFFTYALVLSTFFDIPSEDVGLYILPFAAGNFLGPLLLGRLFDTIGRRQMIAFTYAASGIALTITAWLFVEGALTATGQTIAWSVTFFFASAAASSAYLTVGESFPLEVRALAIAVFYTLGTGVGGIAGPWLFGTLIGTGERSAIAAGYGLGAVLMIIAAAVMWRWGLAAERRSLEDLARPMSSA
ncbi:MFS transporter [Hydrocarboniphaga sp.]|uniref:MFS transporter n=1 Tax=Hydrocarboniphaga sp. TaxID=2033016 RepID=UPI003D1492FB